MSCNGIEPLLGTPVPAQIPWPGEIPGGLAFMKPALLLKDGALKVHAGVGMDLVVGRFRVIPASDHTEPSPLQMPSHLGCTQTCQDCRAD